MAAATATNAANDGHSRTRTGVAIQKALYLAASGVNGRPGCS